MSKRILFVLQNAYRSTKYDFNNYSEWSEDLLRSHSGKRLKEMIPEGASFSVINSSPKIGDCADSFFPADSKYLNAMINKIKPDIICACGVEARNGLNTLGIRFVSAPHPAWRRLSKKETSRIREILRSSI